MKRVYGWKPDMPDGRDLKLTFRKPQLKAAVLKSVDLRKTCKVPPIVDQGPLGSCTGNGCASVTFFDLLNNHVSTAVATAVRIPIDNGQPSRLFIYYNERVMEGTVNEDAGAQIRDGIKSIADYGVCPESEWPYDISKFKTRPPKSAYDHALQFKAVNYYRVDNSAKENIIAALVAGYPIVCGFSVYESFESNKVAKTGTVPMPKKSESLLGGHCIYIVGWTKSTNRFICANSWGTGWGDKGYFTIPAAYLTNTNMADDFWVIDTLL